MKDWRADLSKYLEPEEVITQAAKPRDATHVQPYRPPVPQQQSIKAVLNKRKVAILFHFTPVQNLASICTYGILSRDQAEALADPNVTFPDPYRLDGATWAVCCSIQWPNYKMLYWASKRAEFALLALDLSILWEFDCVFVSANASRHDIRTQISSMIANKHGRVEQLKALFPQEYDYSQWSAYTSDVQAEVLVDGPPIPLKYCRRVFFKSSKAYRRAEALPWPSHIECSYNPELFTYRPDHRFDYHAHSTPGDL